jgi:hypothetical protein
MTALEYLQTFPYLTSKEGDKLGRPSNSELKRWLMKGSVIINGTKPKPWDTITFPIKELILCPNSPNRCTIVSEENNKGS